MDAIEILSQDAHLLAVDKPAGVLTVPGLGPANRDCLIARMGYDFPTARIVHRLDRATSGVLVLALDQVTHRGLSRLFHDRQVRKTYIAIVAGEMDGDEGTIDLPMRKDLERSRATATPWHIIDHVHGKRAITQWRKLPSALERGVKGARNQPLDSALFTTRLALTPITGRSHQLRVHLRAIGHPILGDEIYAPPHIRAASKRLMLHAESLELLHPMTNAPMHFTAPSPF